MPHAPLATRLRSPVDGASVAVVRIGLGLLMAIEGIGYLTSGYLDSAYRDPEFLFTFQGFDWVAPWPDPLLHVHFGLLAVLGLLFAAGVAHRIVGPLLVAAFAYVFLLDKAEYLNHFYAALLILVLLAAAPSDRAFSVPSRRDPSRPRTVPVWAVWMLRFQVGVIYAYAGLAKLGDDWLAGQPMAMWLAERSDLLLIGPLLDEPWAGETFSWAGAAFDLSIVPLLVWRRTRLLALGLAASFHVLNWIIFDIGIFPPMMLVATTVFLDPTWPRDFAARVRAARGTRRRDGAAGDRPHDAPPLAAAAHASGPGGAHRCSRLLVGGLAVYVAVQLLVPLRHHLYPGHVGWTEEGHRFAWQMKLRDKVGVATYTAVDRRTGARWTLDPSDLVTPRQAQRASVRPDMLQQLARRLADRERERGRDVEVRVRALVSLNGRPPADLVDPDRDLARVRRDLGRSDWITDEPPPLGAEP